jgi:hypothetical protein
MTRRYWLALLLGLPAAAKVAPRLVLPPKTIGKTAPHLGHFWLHGAKISSVSSVPRNCIYFLDSKAIFESGPGWTWTQISQGMKS